MSRVNVDRTARRSLILAGVIASVLGSAAAEAQVLEEVVVTAQRREQSLQDVPLSVSALSADSLAVRGINNLADIQPGTVPGLMVGQFAGTPSVLALNMRGVGLSDPAQGTQELVVPVYIDGVFLGRGQGLGLDLIEPERIEILRGPQGQLFGRNAEGGVVQYVTKKPLGEFGVNLSASYGNYEDQVYRLSVDLPSFAGFAVQLSGLKSEHEAYSPQRPQGVYAQQTDFGYSDGEGFRGAIRWTNDDDSFTADYSYDDSDQEDSQPALTWVPVGRPVPGFFSAQVPSSEDYPDEVTQPVFNTPFKVKSSGHALTLAWQVSNAVALKSITAYRETSRHGGSTLSPALPAGLTATADFSAAGFIYPYAGEAVDQDQTSQELQFIGTWSQFDLTAGAIYFNEQVDDSRTSLMTGPAFQNPLDFISPAGLGFCVDFQLDPCLVSDVRQKSETDSWGIYAQGGYRPAALNDKLEISIGLRYTDDSKDAQRFFDLVSGGPVDQRAEFSASRVDPAAIIKYQWTDNLNTYLRYAQGYRAGGANIRSSSFTSFDEEVNEAWELGLKSLFAGGQLQLNAALFYNTIKDEQLTIQETPTTDPSKTNTINSPVDKKVKGVEVEMTWQALENLQLGLNYTYMDADEWREVGNPYDNGAPTRFYQIFTPENSGSVYLDWYMPLPVGALGFHADYAYTSDYWGTPGAIPLSQIGPGYHRPPDGSSQLAARLSWRDIEVGGGQLQFSVWGQNLTDDSSIIYGFDGCALGAGFCTYRAVPRSYGVEVRYQY